MGDTEDILNFKCELDFPEKILSSVIYQLRVHIPTHFDMFHVIQCEEFLSKEATMIN